MPSSGSAYMKMVIKNLLLLIVAFLILSTVVTLAQMRLARMRFEDTYSSTLKEILTSPRLQEQAKEMGMNATEYARYLTYRRLNFKPSFWDSFTYYFRDAFRLSYLKETSHEWGIGFYVKNTFFILILSEILIVPVGLFLGLRAGYNGGFAEKLVSALSPIFSAIPAWFVGALVALLLWNVGYNPDFWMRLQLAITHGSVGYSTYLKLYLPVVLAMFLTFVWEYAFVIRTFIREGKNDYHVMADVAKGLPDSRIRRKLLRLSLPAFLTFTTYSFLDVLMNLLVVELVFDVRGLGILLRWSFYTVNKEPDGVYFFFYPQLLIFVSAVVMFLYFLNSVLMDGFYVKLDPRVSRRE